jgi:hypothetical protein
MQVYTYSEARQKLAAVLDNAAASGKVIIRRQDGRTFALPPQEPPSSPLGIPPFGPGSRRRNWSPWCGSNAPRPEYARPWLDRNNFPLALSQSLLLVDNSGYIVGKESRLGRHGSSSCHARRRGHRRICG